MSICLIAFWVLFPLVYGSYLIRTQGGRDAIYELDDGYRMFGWPRPGILYFPEPINIGGDFQSHPEYLVHGCYKFWSDDDWMLGKAKGEDKTQDAYFAVKKKKDLPSLDEVPDVLVSKEENQKNRELYQHEIFFPVNSVEELSEIVGFDASSINLSRDKPGPLRSKGWFEDYELTNNENR